MQGAVFKADNVRLCWASKLSSQAKILHLPFHPRSCLCLLPKMLSQNKLCSTIRTYCYQLWVSQPCPLLPKSSASGEVLFHIITFLQQKGTSAWFLDDSARIVFFSCALNNSYFSKNPVILLYLFFSFFFLTFGW